MPDHLNPDVRSARGSCRDGIRPGEVLHSLAQLAAAVLSSDGVRTGRTRSLARSLNILKWSLITAPGFSVALLPEIVSCE